jgi:hypothetical protein
VLTAICPVSAKDQSLNVCVVPRRVNARLAPCDIANTRTEVPAMWKVVKGLLVIGAMCLGANANQSVVAQSPQGCYTTPPGSNWGVSMAVGCRPIIRSRSAHVPRSPAQESCRLRGRPVRIRLRWILIGHG